MSILVGSSLKKVTGIRLFKDGSVGKPMFVDKLVIGKDGSSAVIWEDSTSYLKMSTTTGKTSRLDVNDLPDPVAYVDQAGAVQQPFSQRSNLADPQTLVAAEDADSKISSLQQFAFFNCGSLSSAAFDGVLSVGDSAFCNCGNLKDIRCTLLKDVGQEAFMKCLSLSSIDTEEMQKIKQKGFNLCNALQSADFQKIDDFGEYAFKDCASLSAVLLHVESIPTVAPDTFLGSGASTDKAYTTIYVVDSLYKDYITYTNWCNISSQISSFTQPVVTFLSDDTAINPTKVQTLNYGMAAQAPAVSKVGYEFRGWNKTFDIVTADMTCTAQWRRMPLVSYYNTQRTDVPGLTAKQLLSSEYLIVGTDAHQDIVKDLCCTIQGWKHVEWQNADGQALPDASFKNVNDDLSAYAFINKYVDLSIWQKSNKVLLIGHVISGETDDFLSGMSKTSAEIADLLEDIEGYTLRDWNPADGTWNPVYADTSISALYSPNIMSADFYAKYTPKNDTEKTTFISCVTVNYGETIPEFNPKDLCADLLADYYILKNTWTPADIFTRKMTADLTGIADGAYVKFANKVEINFVNDKATKQHLAGDILSAFKYEPGDVIEYPDLKEDNYTRMSFNPSDLDGKVVTEDTKSTDVKVTFLKNTFYVKDGKVEEQNDVLNHYQDDLDPHHLSVLSATLQPDQVKSTPYGIQYAWYDKSNSSWSDFSSTPKDFYDADVISCKYKLTADNFEDDVREVLLSIDSVSATLTYRYRDFNDVWSSNSELSNLHVLKKNRADSDYENFTTLSVPQMTRSMKISSWNDPEGLHLRASHDGTIQAEYELRYFNVVLCVDTDVIYNNNVTYGTNVYQTVSKLGYKFWNWIDEDGNVVDDKLRAVSADISAKAYLEKYHNLSVWRVDDKQAQGKTTTFINEYPFLCSDSSFGTLTAVAYPDLNIPSDCKFSSWDPASWTYKNEDFNLSANCVLKEDNEYTVKFYVNDSLKKEEAVKLNKSATAPDVEYKYSHSLFFKGWNTDEWKNVSRNLTVDAVMADRFWLSYHYLTDKLLLTSCDYESGSAADYSKDVRSISARSHYTTRSIAPASIAQVTSDMSAYIQDEKNWFSDLQVNGPFADDLEEHSLQLTSVAVNPAEAAGSEWSVKYSKHDEDSWSETSPKYKNYGAYTTDIKIESPDVDTLISAVEWSIDEVRFDVSYIYKYLSSMNDTEVELTVVHSGILSNRSDIPPTTVKKPDGTDIDIKDTVCSADFASWQPDTYTRVTSDMSVYAQYNGKQLSVTYFDKDRNEISVEWPVTYYTKSSYDDQDFIRTYAQPDGWKFIEWQDSNGNKRSDEQLMRVVYDLSCYAFCKKWLSADLYLISSDEKTYLSTFIVLSNDILKAKTVQDALDTRPIKDMELKRVMPMSSDVDNGWKIEDDIELSAYYEGLSGEVWFYECYPEY